MMIKAAKALPALVAAAAASVAEVETIEDGPGAPAGWKGRERSLPVNRSDVQYYTPAPTRHPGSKPKDALGQRRAANKRARKARKEVRR